ncbi:tetratricopeptide repeat protein [Nocardia sp. SYP-A9097]|uniref:tetratricopeptide repeat protein n=1 Tax=Nocardia sp. SYP-A9097 TaxID=2663237 RepID=UPI00129AC827|nr:tetratricopeptide repeat protein [Nocardia sp. SYP-A9097]MRH85921.1 tetratricopeptide repeat protein [Nocardia sp. SYP-A9097]
MDSRIEKARVLAELGRLEGARELLGEVLAGEPENWAALVHMSLVALRLGEVERSLRCSAVGLRAYPEASCFWRYRAMGFWEMMRATPDDSKIRRMQYDEALRAAARSVELDPVDVDNLRFLAVVQSATDSDAALATLDRALEIDSDQAGLHAVRGVALRQLWARGPEFTEQAEAAYREALRLDPENAAVAFELARLEYDLGGRELALDHFRMAARLDPGIGDSARQYIDKIEEECARLAPVDTADTDEAVKSHPPEPDPAGPTGGPSTRELAAATPLHRPRRSRGAWLLLFPVLLLLRLMLSSCSADSDGHHPATVTPTRQVPPYNPWSDPGFLSDLRSQQPVPHG